MYLTIIKNGQIIDHRDVGVECLSFEKDSVEHLNDYESLEGMHGLIPLTTKFGGRHLRAVFYVEKENHLEYELVKNEIFRLFTTKTEMTIIDSRQPDRQWNVKVSNTFSVNRVNQRSGQFVVDFLSSSAFAESTNSTLNMVLAQISGSKEQKYKHTTSAFEVLNDGDETINPRHFPLVISFKGVSTNLEIKNLTTGDTWTCAGTTAVSDVVELDGIRFTKNGLSIFRDTNRKLITLAPGWNLVQLAGASGSFEISFDFRFYTI
ncbi:phage tail domain-containing protein [Neobacillus niacini]|uniref:phage tail domain-containing protein n=1 Tax=Neobacillus niacini TaxID=86668 RepID=UPI002FFECE13